MMSRAASHITQLQNYIDGRWSDSAASESHEVINPATGEVIASVALAGSRQVNEAVTAAAAAFPEGRRTPPEDRIQPLFKLKSLLEEHLEDVARGIDETMIRQPLGVVAAITPFNFPGMIPFWSLPYAIATGNTLVLK